MVVVYHHQLDQSAVQWKIIKIVATRSHILKLSNSISAGGLWLSPDDAGGPYSAHSDPLAGF